MYLLESYRVILLQRQPVLHTTATISAIFSSQTDADRTPDADKASTIPVSMLQSLLNPHQTFRGSSEITEDLYCLTTLTILSWYTQPQSSLVIPLSSVWKADHIEVAMHKWKDIVDCSARKAESWLKLLFHTIQLNLYTPIKQVHSLARTHITDVMSGTDQRSSLRIWTHGQECEKAIWHANVMLALAKRLTVLKGVKADRRSSELSVGEDVLSEAPHVPIGIYVGALTIWAYEVCKESPDFGRAQSTLESGIHILAYLHVRIARKLANVLREVACRTGQGL